MHVLRYRRLKRVLLDALAIAPTERAAFLERECGRDAALRRDVEALLEQPPPRLIRDRDWIESVRSALRRR